MAIVFLHIWISNSSVVLTCLGLVLQCRLRQELLDPGTQRRGVTQSFPLHLSVHMDNSNPWPSNPPLKVTQTGLNTFKWHWELSVLIDVNHLHSLVLGKFSLNVVIPIIYT